MQSSLEFFNAPTFFATSCEVYTGKYNGILNENEANPVRDFCSNDDTNHVTCKSPHLDSKIAQIQGLELNLQLKQVEIQLPSYIPVFTRNTFKLPSLNCEQNVVGITLDDIFKTGLARRSTSISVPKSLKIQEEILSSKCFSNKKVLLFGTGQDTLIEKIWTDKGDLDFFNKIAKMGFTAVTGINYSLFHGECPIAHAVNLKRSLLSSSLFQQAGLSSIPHVYALHTHQLKRWIKWFSLNPDVNLFTMNCQLQKSNVDINIVAAVVSRLLIEFPYLKVILHGYQTDHLEKLQKFGDRIIVADSGPVSLSRPNLIYNYYKGGDRRLHRPNLDKSSIISQNIQLKTAFIEQRLGIRS